MGKKYYAVKNGRDGDGIWESWDQCRAQTHGVKGVLFKSFPTRKRRRPSSRRRRRRGRSRPRTPRVGTPQGREGQAVAYVDGSFSRETGEIGCGAVLFYGGERKLFSKKYRDQDLAEMHNVAGEILGAAAVIRYCLEQGIPALEIHHDYEGVGKWAMGLWKANKPGTQAYAALCRQASPRLELRFVKVKGHSGNQWNDLADELAGRPWGRRSPSGKRGPREALPRRRPSLRRGPPCRAALPPRCQAGREPGPPGAGFPSLGAGRAKKRSGAGGAALFCVVTGPSRRPPVAPGRPSAPTGAPPG